ncbi:hypothetical protein KUTeg_016937 [Tegillarca granosa]|uniref:Uncharacterized protein n=1 Tax=Tegillarca granosa TaxID=220873 RepID=A0ABQ9ER36_TEGGR|nr:hypothetical protein KUTeg_016937 [Tegillarca granosa]
MSFYTLFKSFLKIYLDNFKKLLAFYDFKFLVYPDKLLITSVITCIYLNYIARLLVLKCTLNRYITNKCTKFIVLFILITYFDMIIFFIRLKKKSFFNYSIVLVCHY